MKKYYHLLLITAILFSCKQEPPADYLIQNGIIIDGLGNPPIKADLLIRDGIMEIVKRGENIKATETIDATGLSVSPGFIDVHNHSDRSINNKENRLNEGFIRQGVTTIVGGPDGGWSPSQLKEFIEAYDSIGIGTNVAFYIGHNGIRREVMKEDQQRKPTSEELNQMKALVKEGMELGAIGLSTGLMYNPGLFSKTEEVIELAKEVKPYNGIYDSHVRDPVHQFVQSHREAIEISNAANITGKLGHLKAVGLQNGGAISEVIEIVERSRAQGHEIVSDQYPYDGAQTARLEWIIILPEYLVEREVQESHWNKGLYEDLVQSYLADTSLREDIKNASEQGENGGFAWLKATGYSSMRITDCKDFPELVGKYLSEIAQERQMKEFDLVCELILNATESISITLGGINENDVQTLLVQPWNMIASDGFYVEQSGESGGHPRSTGTFPRVLGRYVRELNILPLDEAIRKMTSLPADVIGFKNIGRIQNGMPADITIFNPETISDNSTFEQPNLYASGIIHVFVNGIPVLLNNEMTGNAPGKYLNRRTEANKK